MVMSEEPEFKTPDLDRKYKRYLPIWTEAHLNKDKKLKDRVEQRMMVLNTIRLNRMWIANAVAKELMGE